ncbi:hypothetical protein [Austwickia sp. TVS 96-490-7B]|uniref:hypothetical protein n=1 Tax=Austwickia sp. TVS 96-490-7B TaxID=2830843 RepID=UPI001C599787|nr:hypothetical protein [Austwickia sp. TVS 96-490-7B]
MALHGNNMNQNSIRTATISILLTFACFSAALPLSAHLSRCDLNWHLVALEAFLLIAGTIFGLLARRASNRVKDGK